MGWVSVQGVGRNAWPSFLDEPRPVYHVSGFNNGVPSQYGFSHLGSAAIRCSESEAESWRSAGIAFLEQLRAAERELPSPLLLGAGWWSRALSRRTRLHWRESSRAMQRVRNRWRELDADYQPVREVIEARLAESLARREEDDEIFLRSRDEADRAVWGYVAIGPETPPTVYAYRHDVEQAGEPPAGDPVGRSKEPLHAFGLGQAAVAVTGIDHPPIVWDPNARAATEEAAGRPFDEWWQAHGGAYKIREREPGRPGTITHATSHHSSHGTGYHF
jgi:hypothetical protein